MSDDKPKWNTPEDRKSAAPLEAGELARRFGLSPDRAQMLIDKLGHNPKELEAAAKRLSAQSGNRG